MTSGVRTAGELLVDLADDPAFVDIIGAGDAGLTEPFLASTVDHLVRTGRPSRRIPRSHALACKVGQASPDLVIFQCGRTGSTLLARSMEVGGGLTVLREPPLLARLLGLDERVRPSVEEMKAIAWWYRELARERTTALALKLTSTALLAAPLLRRSFPQVPFVVLVRDPLEVAASCAGSPPPWLDQISMSSVARARLARAHGRSPGPWTPASVSAALWATGLEVLLNVGGPTRWLAYPEVENRLTDTVGRMRSDLGLETGPQTQLDRLRSGDAKGRGRRASHPSLEREAAHRVQAITDPARALLSEAGIPHLDDTSSQR